MHKHRFTPPRPPRRPGSNLVAAFRALAFLASGIGIGAAGSYHWTRGVAVRECRVALEAQVLTSVAPVASAPASQASAPEASPTAAAASGTVTESASAPIAPLAREVASPESAPQPATEASGPVKPATQAESQPLKSSFKAVQRTTPPAKHAAIAETPPAPRIAPVSIPVTASAAAPAAAPPVDTPAQPRPAGVELKRTPLPASSASPEPAGAAPLPRQPETVQDLTPRNPQVIARNGEVVFIRINEKTTLQVKRGTSVNGLGVLQNVDAEGAHFDATVIPLAK